jgi:hypothetical protein
VRDLVTHLMAEGGSLNTIAAALNRAGALNPYGKRWHPTSVAKVVASLGRPPSSVSPQVRGA